MSYITVVAIGAAMSEIAKILDSLHTSCFEDDIMFAFWNDWEGRDGRARIERTMTNGRWSYEKKFFGWGIERWYCCLKQEAAIAKGLP